VWERSASKSPPNGASTPPWQQVTLAAEALRHRVGDRIQYSDHAQRRARGASDLDGRPQRDLGLGASVERHADPAEAGLFPVVPRHDRSELSTPTRTVVMGFLVWSI
jgi:hypothetical protein